jgi:hypothetical protein
MDKNIYPASTCGTGTFADRVVWSRLFATGGGFSEFCQNNPPTGNCSLPACNVPTSILGPADIRGTGWGYAEYMFLGTVTQY